MASLCDVHQVRHGPQGCPLCRRSGQAPTEGPPSTVRRGRLIVAGIAAALALAGLALWVRDSPSDLPLDPQRHRAAVRKLEIVLYRPTLPEPEDRKAIEDAAMALAREVGARRGARAREAALAIEAFSARIGGSGEERLETVSLVEARTEWEELRGQHFAPAAWLSESTPFLEKAQGGPDEARRASAAAEPPPDVEFILEQMLGIVERAEVFLQGLGSCPEAGDYERAAEEWDTWKRSHELDVARAKDSLDPRYGRALGTAFRELSKLSAAPKGGPCNPAQNNEYRVRLLQARGMLKRARESAARMKPAE